MHTCMRYNTIQHNSKQYNTLQHDTTQYNAIQYNTKQYNTIHYITLPCLTTLHFITSPNGGQWGPTKTTTPRKDPPFGFFIIHFRMKDHVFSMVSINQLHFSSRFLRFRRNCWIFQCQGGGLALWYTTAMYNSCRRNQIPFQNRGLSLSLFSIQVLYTIHRQGRIASKIEAWLFAKELLCAPHTENADSLSEWRPGPFLNNC